LAAAKGEQDKAKKKAAKPLANRSAPRSICAMVFPRGLLLLGRIPFAKRNGLLLRPSPDLPAASAAQAGGAARLLTLRLATGGDSRGIGHAHP